jgi:hypothetical protein
MRSAGRLSDLKPEYIGIYTGCLIPTPPSGNLFRVSGRDKNNITGILKAVAGVRDGFDQAIRFSQELVDYCLFRGLI